MTYTPAAAQADTMGIWNYRLTQKGRPPVAILWTETTAVDGSPFLSGRIDSPAAEGALLRFVREGSLGLKYEAGACQQPTLDDSVPGRTACVWRTGGVWVELWHPDTAPAPTPAVMPARASASRLAALLRTRAGDRLPARRTRQPALTKEN